MANMHCMHVLHPHMHHMHGGIYKRVEESSKKKLMKNLGKIRNLLSYCWCILSLKSKVKRLNLYLNLSQSIVNTFSLKLVQTSNPSGPEPLRFRLTIRTVTDFHDNVARFWVSFGCTCKDFVRSLVVFVIDGCTFVSYWVVMVESSKITLWLKINFFDVVS